MGYVPDKLIVHGNAAATANNIVASETLFRLGIAGELLGQAAFIFVALALYDLLKEVNRRHASLMVMLIVVSIPIAFLNELNSFAALVLVRGAEFLSIFDKPQRDALAMFFLNLHGGRVARRSGEINPARSGKRYISSLADISNVIRRGAQNLPVV